MFKRGDFRLPPLSAQDRSTLIKTGWLSHLPIEIRSQLLDACRCYKVAPGQAVTHGGDVTGGIFCIISGTAGVNSAIGSSEAPLIHIAGAGYWFGLFPITVGRPRIISVTAKTPALVATIPQSVLQSLLDQNAQLWRWLNLLALESAALAVQALADLYIGDNERRCAAILLRIAGCREIGAAPVTATLTQDELASLSNLSRATVSKVVRNLAASGHISLGYRTIDILKPAQLRRLVG
jgi:CRP/FNR family transcriptional regulator, cyclic AMP receptor protein